jgi:hypothetical protein
VCVCARVRVCVYCINAIMEMNVRVLHARTHTHTHINIKHCELLFEAFFWKAPNKQRKGWHAHV